MKTLAVIGGNYGDEGKGLMTDYLCAEHRAQFVVRFNGGAQAGHTVQLEDGRRHVFHHFGSGTFAGASTYLGPEFIVNPVLWHREANVLGEIPPMYCHPDAIVTTWHDMLLNQLCEERRSDARHGSCGVGIYETIYRNCKQPLFRFRIGDIVRAPALLGKLLACMTKFWVPQRLSELGLPAEYARRFFAPHFIEDFSDGLAAFVSNVKLSAPDVMFGATVVFEGAQGLLLDKNRTQDMPHLTPSNTGLRNVIPLLKDIGTTELEAVYVTRSYLTRHGNGPLPNEDAELHFDDSTNQPNDWQGSLRFAPLDVEEFEKRILEDFKLTDYRVASLPVHSTLAVAMTCIDQHPGQPMPNLKYTSHGPTRKHVSRT